MRTHVLRITICFLQLSASGLVLLGDWEHVHAQSTPGIGPPFEEAQAVWQGFWTAVIAGDLTDARRYVHSHRIRCEHRGEPAEGQVGLRRDLDGSWRLSLL